MNIFECLCCSLLNDYDFTVNHTKIKTKLVSESMDGPEKRSLFNINIALMTAQLTM